MTFVGMIALSAMTVVPSAVESHEKVLRVAWIILVLWILVALALWVVGRRAGKTIAVPKWAEVTSIVVVALYGLLLLVGVGG